MRRTADDDTGQRPDPVGTAIDRMLEVARQHLRMDVAFVSKFNSGERVLRHVAGSNPDVKAGLSDPLEATYCTLIVDGTLGTLTPDVLAVPALARMEVTERLGIRSYAGVPLVLRDGQVYGTLCAFSGAAHDFDPAEAQALELVAALVANRLSEEHDAELRQQARRLEVEQLLASGALRTHLQPVIALGDGTPAGWEALSRFPEGTHPPDVWFDLAHDVGLTADLELAALRSALALLPRLPSDSFLSVNVSAEAVMDPRVRALLRAQPLHRVVLELTEQHLTPDRARLAASLGDLRAQGARLAMDDVGAGYAGLERVLRLQPEIIKLDRHIVAGVAADHGRSAMVGAFASFARAVGTAVVAEGVESQDDADALRHLGVEMAQGYLFGRPAPPPAG
jgi:EAL domain-containing protein (putative c-di-GMP-specific phosphodiesterase class I)